MREGCQFQTRTGGKVERGWLSLPWSEKLNPTPPHFPTASLCGPLQGNAWELAIETRRNEAAGGGSLGSGGPRAQAVRSLPQQPRRPGALGRMAGRKGLGLGEREAGQAAEITSFPLLPPEQRRPLKHRPITVASSTGPGLPRPPPDAAPWLGKFPKSGK